MKRMILVATLLALLAGSAPGVRIASAMQATDLAGAAVHNHDGAGQLPDGRCHTGSQCGD